MKDEYSYFWVSILAPSIGAVAGAIGGSVAGVYIAEAINSSAGYSDIARYSLDAAIGLAGLGAGAIICGKAVGGLVDLILDHLANKS